MRFVDLFCGLGGFHLALSALGHECVFASEIDEELRNIYVRNFPSMKERTFGDIRQAKAMVPKHDVLCAGFPCQPFSKSGNQKGIRDKTRGTLFHVILELLEAHQPKYVLLENVGNFERHDSGRTWAIVKASLKTLGYDVWGTEHVTSGGHGLVSPHHLGFPHHRERFFVVASTAPLIEDPFPPRNRERPTSLRDIVQRKSEFSKNDIEETTIPVHYVRCVDHWNRLLKKIPKRVALPSFPIWGDELDAKYPFETSTPYATSIHRLRKALGRSARGKTKKQLLLSLPSYARTEEDVFPEWKRYFIRQNRDWFNTIERYISHDWKRELRQFPPSLRKLEWNCQGELRNLWKMVLQFRPSGLRAKRYSSSPALVAMTASQIPILGPKRRFISRVEGLRLQGFPDDHALPHGRENAFRALGNAVHVDVVREIARAAFSNSARKTQAVKLVSGRLQREEVAA